MLNVLAISNYRSLRNLVAPLQRLNLVTGPNGSGKSTFGETTIVGRTNVDAPAWNWPSR